jgi:hypothetical protein
VPHRFKVATVIGIVVAVMLAYLIGGAVVAGVTFPFALLGGGLSMTAGRFLRYSGWCAVAVIALAITALSL